MRKIFFKKVVATMAVATMVAGTFTTAYAADEKVTYYFVDCGDYTVDSIADATETSDDTRDDADAMGIYQSVTDKAYGADASTGKSWGIVADAYTGPEYDASQLGVRLNGAWAFEYNAPASNIHRNWSNTYSNGCPAGQAPTLTWKFELPAGTYEVEVCAVNPWNNCSNVTVKGNDTAIGTIDTIVVTNGAATDIETKYGGATVKGNVTVGADGVLTLVASNGNDNSAANQCVNIAWIKIVGDAPATNNNTNTITNTNNGQSGSQDTADFAAVMPMVALAVVAMAAVMVARKRTVTE